MAEFWRSVLVVPLLNLLIFFYNTVAFGNLGLAVIELTVALRFLLLPLTALSERDKARYERLSHEVEKIQEQFKNDPVLAKDQIREHLTKNRVNPWAKSLLLFLQLLVLIVLYRVFLRGINANLDSLYAWVQHPSLPINVDFFGFDIGQRNFFWSLSVGVILYVEIVMDQRKYAHVLGTSDAVFRYAFPIFSVVILSLLPMVKTLFILTTMAFSIIVSFIRRSLWPTDSTS